MESPLNPYAALPRERFWKTAVAERGGEAYDNLWSPRFPIDRGTRFATAGSCFAQHISRWLRGHGYRWIDSEPAPPGSSETDGADSGHGIFSFRTGNIYSAALLQQWVTWALGSAMPPDEAWSEEGRWFDPFRPGIPKAGFDSREAMLDARRETLACIRAALAETDVLIFTLGLTEAWVHADGHVYPMCPGTLRGRFDAAQHRFVNFDVPGVQRRLHETFDALRALNPAMRFLLTVSPVPLTATADQTHVLLATTYSKAVLRAAAGALVRERDDTDYFPSYELIAGAPSRGRFFEGNLRSVTREGVDFVMGHFARGLGEPDAGSIATPAAGATPTAAAPPSSSQRADEVACEDVMLSAWSRRHDRADAAAMRLCLLGDSHMGKLSQALGRAGIGHWGGMIMKGSGWFGGKFHPDADEIFVPLENKLARSRWTETLTFFTAEVDVPAAERTVLTNLALHTHVSVPAYLQWVKKKHAGELQIDGDEAVAFFRQANKGTIALLQALVARGYRVVVVTDPPTQALNAGNRPVLGAFEVYELVARHVLTDLGCTVFSARDHFKRTGFTDAYHATYVYPNGMRDWIHGSDAYYDALVGGLAAAGLVAEAATA